MEPGLRRAGIGTLALEELMRSITGAGMVRVEAEDDLVGFYERVGFRPTLRTPAPDGAPVTFLEAVNVEAARTLLAMDRVERGAIRRARR